MLTHVGVTWTCPRQTQSRDSLSKSPKPQNELHVLHHCLSAEELRLHRNVDNYCLLRPDPASSSTAAAAAASGAADSSSSSLHLSGTTTSTSAAGSTTPGVAPSAVKKYLRTVCPKPCGTKSGKAVAANFLTKNSIKFRNCPLMILLGRHNFEIPFLATFCLIFQSIITITHTK